MELTGDIAAKLGNLNEALKKVESSIKKYAEVGEEDYSSLSAVDKAEHNLISVYTLLSLYWGLLKVRGIDPKKYELKKDFERVQEGLKKVSELRDKSKAPQVNKVAAERFVRSALWEAKSVEVEKNVEAAVNLEPARKRVKTSDAGGAPN